MAVFHFFSCPVVLVLLVHLVHLVFILFFFTFSSKLVEFKVLGSNFKAQSSRFKS